MPDLLFELGTEEVPAGYLPAAIEHLRKDAAERLRALGIAHKSVFATGTPRRLVLFVEELPLAQPARTEEVLGPPEKAAWKDGQPTQAAKGFAEKNGLKVADLVVKETPRGRYIVLEKRVEGRRTAELLPEMLVALVKAIPFPKTMRWPQAPGTTFPRPIRRVVAILGHEPLALEIAGQKAGRATVGHPFLTGDRPLVLDTASYSDLRALLKSHHVVVDRNERRGLIESALGVVYQEHGASPSHHDLLEEVTDLVELPEVVTGAFDEKYLALPREVVEAAMTDHQRYFPLAAGGKLLPRFAFVMNRPAAHAARVREGNERVLRARLEDASFYLAEDLKRPLDQRVESLKGIVFQEKLGTMHRKMERLVALVEPVASQLGLSEQDTAAARRAALLSKADLTTELVKEFPQLQGAVGATYAAMQGEPVPAADAIREQYLPRGAGDELPRTPAGTALALAEKLDNLVGFFSIGIVPTGSQDPYALRRQAAGVVRILLHLDAAPAVSGLVSLAVRAFSLCHGPSFAFPGGMHQAVVDFVVERARHSFLDQGYRYDLIDAAMATGADDLVDLRRRLDATVALSKEPFFQDLIELVERTFNISRSLTTARAVDAALLKEDAERALHATWEEVRQAIAPALERRDYAAAARAYVERLKAPVHEFMAKVFVNDKDEAVKLNRMALVRSIWAGFAESVADLAKVVEGKRPVEGKK